MARVVPRFSLLFFLVALVSQGCDCDCGSTTNGDGDGDVDGMVGDGNVGDGTVGDGNVDALVDGNQPDVPPFIPPDVHVLITADNAYGFGYGSASALTNYFMGIEDGGNDIFVCSEACGPGDPCTNPAHECDIFGTCNADRKGPETYVVPGNMAPQDGYLYVIVWSDESVTQGLIGQFQASDGLSPPVYTGSDKWEVCATGVDIDLPDPDPSIGDINTQIANCNMGAAGPTFSDGWIGDDLGNNPKGNMELTVLSDVSMEPPQFAPLCQDVMPAVGDSLDAAARWMWFDDDRTAAPSAFQSNGMPRGDFLIFRLPISAVIIIE